MASTSGRRVVIPLTNKSGGSVAAGDVVILDTSNDSAFTTTTTSRYEGTIGIAQEAISDNAVGRVLIQGEAALVNVPASVTRGHYIETHTVAKQATGSSTRRSGSFGQFKTGGATPSAVLGLFSDPTASGGSTTFVGCKVYHNTTQTISNGTDTQLNFNAEEFDTDAMHDTVTNNTRITVASGKDGKYVAGGTVSWAGNATGVRFARFLKNGAAVRGGHSGGAGVSSGGPVIDINDVFDLVANDYIEIDVYQTSGGNLTVGDGTNAYGQTTFWLIKVG